MMNDSRRRYFSLLLIILVILFICYMTRDNKLGEHQIVTPIEISHDTAVPEPTSEPEPVIEAVVLKPGDVFEDNPIVGKLHYVAATDTDGYVQGSPTSEIGRFSDEDQFTHVLTRDIAVMATEVTQGMWSALREKMPVLPLDPSRKKFGIGPEYPVNGVTWFETILFANLLSVSSELTPCYYKDPGLTQAILEEIPTTVFCNFDADGYRLLSEGEWEYACRANSRTPFCIEVSTYDIARANGDVSCSPGLHKALEEYAIFCGNDSLGSAAVGERKANALNLCDMHGNVWEWCWDLYSVYPKESARDFVGALEGLHRVLRGGSWNNYIRSCRSAVRYKLTPSYRSEDTGFRLARTVEKK